MIIHEKNEKTLVIPSALGNFGNGGGTGGGVTSGQVVEIVESAITEYDENTVEPKIEALSGATSGLSEDITLLETTVGNHTTDIEALSAATEQLEDKFSAYTPTSGFATINGSGITNGGNLVIAGGATAYYFKDMERSELAALYTLLETEAGRPDTEGVLSASTINEKYAFYGNFGEGQENVRLYFNGFYFGRAVFVNTLSKEDTADGISNYLIWLQSDGTFEQQRKRGFNFPKDFQFLKNYLQGGKTFPFRYDKGTGVFSAKNDYGEYETLSSANTYGFDSSVYWFALSDGDWADGIAELPFQIISGETVLDTYSFPTVRREAINEVIDEVTYTQKWYFDYGDFVFSLIANEDLTTRGFEYTEAQAGGSSVRTYILNRMTQQELKDLYDELAPYGTPNTGVNSAFTPSEWAFFLQYEDNEWDFGGDGFRGILPLTIASIHPSDYGGAIFFTGVGGSRSGSNSVLKVRYVVAADGSTDKNAGWIEIPNASPWGFSWPDNGKLCYDADNSKFVMVNWYDPGTGQRDVDTTGNTYGVCAAASVDRFLNEGNWYADDRNGYAQPRFEMTVLSGGSVYSYVFPSIFGETITSTTIDGQTYTRRYSFTYTREDGSAFVVNMLLNDDQFGAQIEYENVESGGGEGITDYYLNKMTQAELAALYAELDVYRNSDDTPNVDEEEGYPAGKYRFFYYNGNNDEFKGYYELQLARFDSSGGIDFSANFQSRYNSKIFQKGIRLHSDGRLEERFSNSANLTTYELPAATDQVLGGVKIGSGITVDSGGTISVEGGGAGLVHLETLSGVSGETNVMYECDGELFRWNENSGNFGIWSCSGRTNSGRNGINVISNGYKYTVLPDNTQICSIDFGYVADDTATAYQYKIVYSGGTLYLERRSNNAIVGTLGPNSEGALYSASTYVQLNRSLSFEGNVYKGIYAINKPHYIGVQLITDNFYNTSYISPTTAQTTTTNEPHWEFLDSDVKPYVRYKPLGASLTNEKGYPTGWFPTNQTTLKLNGSGLTLLGGMEWDNGKTLYAPTTSGTTGQVLTSNGNSAPTWATLIKSVKITTAEYDALVQAGRTDPNTLYLIDDE